MTDRPPIDIDPDTAGLKPGDLARAIGTTPRVTSDLITVCLGEASIVQASGKGSRRVLSLKDSMLVALGKQFRDYGFPPGRVRYVCDFLRKHWEEAIPLKFRATPMQVTIGSDKGFSLKAWGKYKEDQWLLVGHPNFFHMGDVEISHGPSGKPRPEYVYLKILNKDDLGKALDGFMLGQALIVLNLTRCAADLVGRTLWSIRVK